VADRRTDGSLFSRRLRVTWREAILGQTLSAIIYSSHPQQPLCVVAICRCCKFALPYNAVPIYPLCKWQKFVAYQTLPSFAVFSKHKHICRSTTGFETRSIDKEFFYTFEDKENEYNSKIPRTFQKFLFKRESVSCQMTSFSLNIYILYETCY
jgi:hypothetical protein